MPYVARVTTQNGQTVSLRQQGQPSMIEIEVDGCVVQCHSGLPEVLVMESESEFQALCAANGINAKIVEIQDC